MNTENFKTFQEAREFIVSIQSRLTAESINKWNENCQNPDESEAIRWADGMRVILNIHDARLKNIKKMKDQLEMWTGCLMSHNFVVGWEDNGLTVRCDLKKNDDGRYDVIKADINASVIPVLWTEQDAGKIAAGTKNGAGVAPRVFEKKDWLRRQISRLEKDTLWVELNIIK